MWILPKQLHTSASVQATKESGLDSEEFSLICEKSLTWRGKDSQSRTWLQRWKRESWIQHLCSRTLKPSHTASFVDAWTSSLADSRANRSVLLESVKALKTPDISSHTSETESGSANLELFSSKTLRELSQVRPPMENRFSSMSSESWKAWVTEQRQEYSQRVKSAHLIRESVSLSWATPNTMDHMAQRSPEALKRQFETTRKGRTQPANLLEQVHPQNWPTARTSDAEGGRIETEMTEQGFKSKRHKSNQTFGAKLRDAVETHEENWPTASARDWKDTAGMSKERDGKALGRVDQLPRAVYHYDGLQDQANLSTSGKNQESWPTPRANKVHPEITDQNREQLANRGKANLEEDVAGHCGKATGKLNPNWVEQLMGLPVGWTDLGSWAME